MKISMWHAEPHPRQGLALKTNRATELSNQHFSLGPSHLAVIDK